jgi:iron(III) transport system substrate-binding protein
MKISFRALLLGAAMLGLAAPAFAQDADWAKVVAAAKQEGTVTFYFSVLGDQKQLAIFNKFQAETGIKVQLLDVRASELEARVRAEKAANKITADVMMNGLDAIIADNKDGLIGDLAEVPNMKKLKPDTAKFVSKIATPIYFLPYGILVNTDMVKPADEPKSWLDLTDPKWKGKIQSDDVRAPGGGFVWFSATLHVFGQDYEKKMAAQNLVFSRSVADDEQRVARGEFPMRIPQIFGNWLTILQGLPVKLVVPKEGASYIQFQLAVAAGAPHPNAARVFINYLLSEEAQAGFANKALLPAVQVDPAKVDPAARSLADSKLLGTTDPAVRDAELKLAGEIYK